MGRGAVDMIPGSPRTRAPPSARRLGSRPCFSAAAGDLQRTRSRSTGVILIGVGNAWRGGDGAGLAVARRVREPAPAGVDIREVEGDATTLLEAWAGAEHVAVVDAGESGAAAGTVLRFDGCSQPLPVGGLRSSTHAFGVSDAVELARALGHLPD